MLNVDTLISFLTVLDQGSFSAAAVKLGQTPSGISRVISRLESQLGVTLINRTTRRLDVTDEGKWLAVKARKIVDELAQTEAELSANLNQLKGKVRINAASPVFNHLLAPHLAEFQARYPCICLELTSGETIVDLIEERADLAIRIGELRDSTLRVRKLGESQIRLLAAPAYLQRCGTPQSVEDLQQHCLLGFTSPSSLNAWPIKLPNKLQSELPKQEGESEQLVIEGKVLASNGETLRHLAIHGAGIVCLADFMTESDRAQGSLVPVLEKQLLVQKQTISAVFYRHEVVAPRIKALVEFLVEKLDRPLQPR
ncbi:LysR family transcriptional regulator [Undibacterium amnicola]|uniref:LysR family transcriptional regulator n=1 Tax=Undibacterium amnicola TaxID=1834038 RepID=A0ABR6XWB1_9BURK|nr:LysR family transcriptional regulator [Undibacterium amnicola]MBC3833289.1 LysR family transcriptional regulator [Undibacterium amnicola]